MELKDLVLSTLEELDNRIEEAAQSQRESEVAQKPQTGSRDEEIAFLEHTKERLEVLFKGLHSSEIKEPEAKLEITLKYLQLLLAQVDARLQQIK
jgi:hypothetical protein